MRLTKYPWGDDPMPAIAHTRTDSKGRALCAGKTADGEPCETLAAAEMTFDGISYCMRHGKKIIKTKQEVKADLDRYREYQESAFGAIVAGWPSPDLIRRLHELNATPGTGLSETRLVRNDAEGMAIERELARRKGATT